ncbi:MAG TPA: histidine kinase, partial [Pyrinomonadaceae bacterium]
LTGGMLTKEYPTFISLFTYQLFANLPMKVSIYWLVLIAINAIDYYHSFLIAEVKASELRVQLAQAQLRALKMQLHPHFLFNTLNSISALLHRDAEAADQMVARLGDFLRLTLENSGDQEVTLEQEIAFLRCYLEIEIIRHDRLSVETDIEPQTLAALVPNLILQPLVENAIRHGVSPCESPGTISISAYRAGRMLHVEVSDDGPGLQSGWRIEESGGIGLGNTVERLRRLYGPDHRFELRNVVGAGSGVTASVVIPFREGRGAAA